MEPSFLLGFNLPKGGDAKRTPDRSCAGCILFEAICHEIHYRKLLTAQPK